MKPSHIFSLRLLSAFAVLAASSLTSDAVLRHPGMTDTQALALGDLPQFESKAGSLGCSAAMLNSEWAVSAAHCISLADEQRVTLTYETGGVSNTVTGTAYRVQSGDGGYDDVMLIHLDTPITSAVAWVAPYDRFDEYEQLGWQVGRGTSGALGVNTTSDGKFRAMTQRIYSTLLGEASIIPQHIYYNFNNPEVTNPNEYATFYEGGTGPGDSGGPLYVYSRGRYFNASVVSGPQGGSYRNGRLSTHLPAIIARSNLEFAYPQQLVPRAVWVAEDLIATTADQATVVTWSDRLAGLTWSSSSDGGGGAPTLRTSLSPTGLAAVRFDGDDVMGLSSSENPIKGQTSFSIAMVVRSDVTGAGLEGDPFGSIGVLDASSGDNAWSLSFAHNGRYGLSIEDQEGSVKGIFRGGSDNASIADGDWHVIVATWDGSELSFDNAGDDRNMKLYVDQVDQVRTGQGAYHFNVARGAVSLLLGDSQTNALAGFSGDIAEIRLYTGELQMHEVDRLLVGLRERYLTAETPGVVFERPWAKHLSIPAGQSLQTRGFLTGGADSLTWSLESGPAPVTFTNVDSVHTEIIFEAVGTHVLRATVTDGINTGFEEIAVDVDVPGTTPSATTHVLDGNWISIDIGSLGTAGSHLEAAGVHTLTGAGQGVGIGEGATYDQGQFVWQGVAGDFDYVARLDSLTNVSGPTRAGLMVRGGEGPTDAAAFIGIAPDGTYYVLHRRDGGWYAELTNYSATGISLPAYLKLERRGNLLATYISADGIAYTELGTAAEVALPGVARVGMFATSGDSAATISAQFSALTLEQKSLAKATSISTLRQAQSGGFIELDPQLGDTDEPWLEVAVVAGESTPEFAPDYVGHRQYARALLSAGGDYRARLSVDDGNTLTYTERTIPTIFNLSYRFDTDADTQGWTSNNVDGLTASLGSLEGTANTNDPQLVRNGLSVDGNIYDKLEIRMSASVNTSVQVFWSTTTELGFVAARSATLNYNGSGAMQALELNPQNFDGWTGRTITGLRIDPIASPATSETFQVDSIVISDGNPQPLRPAYLFEAGGDFEGWSPSAIDSVYIIGGALHGTSSSNDPKLTRTAVNFQADDVESVLVKIRSTSAGVMDFFWTTTENSAFSATRKVGVSFTGSGSDQVIRIPLAGNTEWDGQSIVNLRLDPINVSGVDFAISAIVASDGDADSDSMPDVYELANSLEALDAADAEIDADLDGLSNLEEYIAGTDLNDPAARLRATGAYATGSPFAVNLSGVTGRLYSLKRKLSLTDLTWTSVDSEGPLSVDGLVTLEDGQLFDAAFYRVEVSLP